MDFIDAIKFQDNSLVNDVLGILGQGWRYLFSFCLRFGTNMRNFDALRDHIFVI